MWTLSRHLLFGAVRPVRFTTARCLLSTSSSSSSSSSSGSSGGGDSDESSNSTKTTTTSEKNLNKPQDAVSATNQSPSPPPPQPHLDKPKDPHIIVGPDGIPYDPREDPEYHVAEHGRYKYPQYFTRHLGLHRVAKIIKNDLSLLRKGQIHPTREQLGSPNDVDVLVIGGGIIGSAVAYQIANKAPFSLRVGMIERDPTYSRASTTLSAGGIRQQWSMPENVMMSMYTADFLRNVKRHLSILDGEPPEVSFTPQGYLTLATNETEAQAMVDNHKMQLELGALVELYTADRLKQKFPHINTDGVLLGSYGVQNEGWFDPWALLLSLRAKAQCLGVEMIHADLVDFNFKTELASSPSHRVDGLTSEPLEQCNHAVIREPDGNVKHIRFAYAVICCGPQSGEVAKMLGYGSRRGVRAVPFPVEPRKRYVYVFNCRDGPGLDFPFLINNTGDYVRREGLGGNFICGRSPPTPEDEPDVDNLDVDYTYFERAVHPLLAARVPAFEAIKLKGGWAGFYDYNTLDEQPIIGFDPYYSTILWATGFSGHGLQMAPAVGRAIMELILYDEEYKTIDLTRFSWDRVLQNRPLARDIIV